MKIKLSKNALQFLNENATKYKSIFREIYFAPFIYSRDPYDKDDGYEMTNLHNATKNDLQLVGLNNLFTEDQMKEFAHWVRHNPSIKDGMVISEQTVSELLIEYKFST